MIRRPTNLAILLLLVLPTTLSAFGATPAKDSIHFIDFDSSAKVIEIALDGDDESSRRIRIEGQKYGLDLVVAGQGAAEKRFEGAFSSSVFLSAIGTLTLGDPKEKRVFFLEEN